MSAFEACHSITARWERGYANHPRDPGGSTLNGVTANVYRAYRRRKGMQARHISTMEVSEELDIYRSQYWDVVSGDKLPPGIDLAVYDLAVNSGPNRAIRYLQAALGLKQDGHLGNVTLEAAMNAYRADTDASVIDHIMRSRNRFLRSLNTWDVFGKGWSNRTRDIEAKAKRMEQVEDTAKLFAVTAKKKSTSKADLADNPPYIQDPAQTAKEPAVTSQKAGWLSGAAAALASVGTAVYTAVGAVKTLLDDVLPSGGAVMLTVLIVVSIAAAFVSWQKHKEAANV